MGRWGEAGGGRGVGGGVGGVGAASCGRVFEGGHYTLRQQYKRICAVLGTFATSGQPKWTLRGGAWNGPNAVLGFAHFRKPQVWQLSRKTSSHQGATQVHRNSPQKLLK